MFSAIRAPSMRLASATLHPGACKRLMSSNVSAALVKELRARSGAPMMDCKKALMAEGVDGDIAKAIDYLRVKGLAKASSNTRVAAEGLIGYYSNGQTATMVEVNCETDFVNNNKLFQDFVSNVAVTANGLGPGEISSDTLMDAKCARGDSGKMRDALGDIVTAIRENIIVRRATSMPLQREHVVSAYMHGKVTHDNAEDGILLGSRLGVVILDVSGGLESQRAVLEDAGKRLAMHVVAAKPSFLGRSSVPGDVLERETAICREQTEATSAGKKTEIIEKMVSGKLSKRLAEICLMDQAHMAEEGSPIVSKHLASLSATMKLDVRLHGFFLWQIGQTTSSDSHQEDK